jgi:hypothetical protein
MLYCAIAFPIPPQPNLYSVTNGVIDECDRPKLRAELDAIIAHLYGLTEAEFAYILTTFPIVPEQVKQNAITAYRVFAPLTGNAENVKFSSRDHTLYLIVDLLHSCV